MNKKLSFIILIIALILIIFGIYNFSSNKKKNDITNINSEIELEDNQENVQENITENQEQNVEEGKTNNATVVESETSENEKENNNTGKIVVEQVSPSGFMGSSLYRVKLYSNGEVYVEKFDGNGYEKENIISNDLIAKNVDSIKAAEDEEHYGEVIINGGEVVNNNWGWIDFE